jgi:hypothetical protein
LPHLGFTRFVRPVMLVLGLALAAGLVWSVGTERVLAVLSTSGHWLPLVVLLEATFATCDAIAVRVLLGPDGKDVPGMTWVRATALTYASTALLPAGRVAGEAARAATLAPQVGMRRALAACTRLQICALLANVVISGACVVAVRFSRATALASALALNALACAALATAFLAALRSKRVANWLDGRFGFSHDPAQSRPPLTRPRALVAQGFCVLGRTSQTLQYAVVLLAVGGLVTPASALTAQGIHLVGAAAGDVIPGQLGAMEGTYRLFAGALGFGSRPELALTMPLLVRVAQLSIAIASLSAFGTRPSSGASAGALHP